MTADAVDHAHLHCDQRGRRRDPVVQLKHDGSPPSKPRFRDIKAGQITKRRLALEEGVEIECPGGGRDVGVVRSASRGLSRARDAAASTATAVNGAGLGFAARPTTASWGRYRG